MWDTSVKLFFFPNPTDLENKMSVFHNFQIPFNMYLIGSTGSGKTYTLLKILENELFQKFTYIFLLNPTYEDNETYQNWKYKYDEKFIVLNISQENVEGYLSLIMKNYRNTNSCLVLDDIAACQSVKQRTGPLVDLAFSGRHAGFSTIVISQHFSSITPSFRDNCQHILVFYTLDESDWFAISKSFLPRLSKETRNEIYDTLEKTKYSYFLIARGVKRLIKPNGDVINFK